MRPSLLLVLALAMIQPATADYPTGLRLTTYESELGEATLAIWYPTQAEPLPHQIGPFDDVLVAMDAPVAQGRFPVVLLSHGRAGNWRNHHPTATKLSHAGFVVVTPQHPTDSLLLERRINEVAAAETRPKELLQALEATRNDPQLAGALDEASVSVIGFSLGGMSALTAAGGNPSLQVWIDHCRDNGHLDPACSGRWRYRLLRLTQKFLAATRELLGRNPREGSIDAQEFKPLENQLRPQALILVDPVGAPFGPGSLDSLTGPVLVYRLGEGEVLALPFHAENIRDLLGDKATYKVFENAHHHSFIAPFAERTGRDFPAARDPKDFARQEFLDEINKDILSFLLSHANAKR